MEVENLFKTEIICMYEKKSKKVIWGFILL